MTDEVMTREDILDNLVNAIALHEQISSLIGKRLCEDCQSPEEEWEEKRKKITANLKALMSKYSFARRLPRTELGVAALSILNYIIKIQHTFAQIIVMIDMIKGESFGEVYMDSMNSISSKMHEQISTLRKLAEEQKSNPEIALAHLNSIVKLERQIDEDNIVICRQISVNTEGETGYTCYVMRKIVSELEHISDYIKVAAEIIVDI